MRLYIIFSVFFICLLWSSCNIINPPEKTPTYIHIDSFNFSNPKPGITGSASHAIGSVWAIYNGSVVGVFDLPATIPILATGSGSLYFEPGVTLNGMNNFQAVYPYYYYDTLTLVAQPGKVINHTPQTRYIDNGIHFPFIEDFELGSSFDTIQGKPLSRTTAVDSVFEGKGSGVIRLNGVGDTSLVFFSGSSISIPAGVSYCEFNYKGTLDLKIGMINKIVDIHPYFLYGFTPSNTWQKVYVSLGEYVQGNSGGSFTLCFTAGIPAGQTSGYLLLDNIKIVDSGN